MFEEYLKECKLCPRECKVNRLENKIGRCKALVNPKVALASLHYYEEPCISGKSGSGTVFFSGCNLSCKFCQNYEISQLGKGIEISIEELSNKLLDLQKQGANNINLVTGFAYVPQIIDALELAKKKGLNIPIVYNSSGYESVETIKLLNGYVDVYLPDLKYGFTELATRLSDCADYFDKAKIAIKEMVNQVGSPKFDENGMIKKGVIIRHLVLPNHIQNSKKILKWIKENLPKNIYISIMAQYFPTYKAELFEDINKKLKEDELNKIIDYIDDIGIENGYIQNIEDDEKKYVPNF